MEKLMRKPKTANPIYTVKSAGKVKKLEIPYRQVPLASRIQPLLGTPTASPIKSTCS
jgi:hypothetical protein